MTNKVFFSKTLYCAVIKYRKMWPHAINILFCVDSEYKCMMHLIFVCNMFVFSNKAEVLLRCVAVIHTETI